MDFNRGKYIRDLRERHFERKISREKLAEKIGVAGMTIQRWESNEGSIKEEHLERLADFFGVSLASFFGGPQKSDVEDAIKEKNHEINALKAELYDAIKKLDNLKNYASDPNLALVIKSLIDLRENDHEHFKLICEACAMISTIEKRKVETLFIALKALKSHNSEPKDLFKPGSRFNPLKKKA